QKIETALEVDWLSIFAAVNGLDSLYQHWVSSDRNEVGFEVSRVEPPIVGREGEPGIQTGGYQPRVPLHLVDHIAEEVDDDPLGEDPAINAIDYLTSCLEQVELREPEASSQFENGLVRRGEKS